MSRVTHSSIRVTHRASCHTQSSVSHRASCHVSHTASCHAPLHCHPAYSALLSRVTQFRQPMLRPPGARQQAGRGENSQSAQYSAARPLAPACPPVLYAQLHNRNQHLSAILPTPSVCRFITITISLTPSVCRFPRAQVSSEPQPPVPAPAAAAEEEALGGVPAQLPQRHQHPGWVDISGVDMSSVDISRVDT